MEYGSETLGRLVNAFSRMPGIGPKSALRLALHLLRRRDDTAAELGSLLLALGETVKFCGSCGAITETDQCAICTDPARDRHIICVVEQPQDVFTLEKTNQFKGLYHVLHGVLSPLDGVTPEKLNLTSLEPRVRRDGVKEVIVATNPTVEGDTTALYIAKTLAGAGCTVTRLARGLPMGGTLEFADDTTIIKAIERRERL